MENRLQCQIDVMSRMNHPGLELFNTPAQGDRPPEPVARGEFQQLIGALDDRHSLNAIHRDLKPESLLLDAEDRLKNADIRRSVFSGGSPDNITPERFHADGYAGAPEHLERGNHSLCYQGGRFAVRCAEHHRPCSPKHGCSSRTFILSATRRG
jgi:serine/threonine protein kinase